MMLFVVILALIPLGIVAFKEAQFLFRVRNCSHKVNAVVNSLHEKQLFGSASHRSTFIPTVRYEYDGVGYEAQAEHSYFYDVYAKDTETTIYVDPSCPSRMILAGERREAVRGMITAIVIVPLFAFLWAYYKRVSR